MYKMTNFIGGGQIDEQFDYSAKYFKVVGKNRNKFKYRVGLNIDPLSFNPSGSCTHGGLYFTTFLHLHDYLQCGNTIAIIQIPAETPVYCDPCKTKWKAPRLIVERFISLVEFNRSINQSRLCKEMFAKETSTLEQYAINNCYPVQHVFISYNKKTWWDMIERDSDGWKYVYIQDMQLMARVCLHYPLSLRYYLSNHYRGPVDLEYSNYRWIRYEKYEQRQGICSANSYVKGLSISNLVALSQKGRILEIYPKHRFTAMWMAYLRAGYYCSLVPSHLLTAEIIAGLKSQLAFLANLDSIRADIDMRAGIKDSERIEIFAAIDKCIDDGRRIFKGFDDGLPVNIE